MADNGISDFFVATAPNLSGLDDGLAPLAGLTNLKYLSLAGNRFRDVRPLAGLDRLNWLELRGNQIANIDALLGQTIIDNLEAGYYEVGQNWTGNSNSQAFEDDYRLLSGLNPASRAYYEFKNLAPGVYDILTTWTAGSSHSGSAVLHLSPARSLTEL
jgi:Leucine-rich repeat (LRR) protein